MGDIISNFNIYGIYINFLLILYICLKCYESNIISKEVFYLLVISCLGPILFNFYPFVGSIFPDQGGYFDNIKSFRQYHDFEILRHSDFNKFFSIMLSTVPIPLVDTIFQATFINKFIIVIFIIYLIKFKYIKNTQAIILLLYPSLFLYSSLMLKEITIIFLLSLSYLFLTKKKYIFCLFCMGLTFLIKPYLAMLFLIIYLIKISLIMKPKLEYVIYFFLSIFLIIFIYDDSFISLLNRINLFIYNFNLEGSGYSTEAKNYTKNLLKFDLSSFIYIIKSIVLYFFKPLIYEIKNLPQLFQSLENIFVFLTLIYYLEKLYRKDIIKTCYIILSIFIVSFPYAIIVSNVGTLSRYRFTILIIFLFIIFIELNQFKKKNEKY